MTVQKISTRLPVSDEAIVDYAIGTADQQRAAAERIEVRQAESEARWKALPFWTRWNRTMQSKMREPRHRLSHAVAAFRGIDCEP